MSLKNRLHSLLKRAGKGNQKVAAVFGRSPELCHAAVVHVHNGAPTIPIWLYSTARPSSATAAFCERVCVRHSTIALLVHAEAELWRRWVALGVTAWTGERGAWPLKLAPFAIPPFRAVLLNEHGDFFAGSPAAIALHARHRLKDGLYSTINRAQDLWLLGASHVSARLLWISATILRLLGYPHRKIFNSMTGDEALPIALRPANGTTVSVFTPKAKGWDAEAFEKAVHGSDARWLVWSESGETSEINDLLRLFRDDRTFAVARQEHFRAWTPGIVHTAPFRALQPGEACRVLAPISRTMVIDRQKLAALGVPRCGLPGAMWLLLFWKAAAAGWRSFNVGQDGPAARRPDRPLEETSFFLRLLANRRLRRLQPADADLSRGTISFANGAPAVRARSKCPRVLVVSPFLPYPLSHGGAVRIYNLCRALASKVEFALATIREQKEFVDYARLHEVFSQVNVVDLDELPSPDMALPKQVRHYNSGSLRALIAELAETWQPDLLQIEYTQMAAFRDAAPQTPALLVEHDITFSLYRQLADSRPGGESQAEYERWRRFESHWLRTFDGIWTVSADDRAAAIDEGAAPGSTFSIPNGVDTARYIPSYEPDGAPEILYVGSFRHLPNVIGFDKLRQEVMPRIWERFPQARLSVVAGPDHEMFWQRFAPKGAARIADPRITIQGFVEDVRPLYASATVVAVPLEVSAGTNIKVLEAMASGRAVVSTAVGCAGLGLRDGDDIVIRSDWVSFADALCGLLESPSWRRYLAAEARRTAERLYSWDAIAGQAYASYEALLHHSNSTSDTPWRGSANEMGTCPPAFDTHFGDCSSAR